MNPVHVHPTAVRSTSILSYLRLRVLYSFPFGFPVQNFAHISHPAHGRYMPHPSNHSWFNHPNNSVRYYLNYVNCKNTEWTNETDVTVQCFLKMLTMTELVNKYRCLVEPQDASPCRIWGSNGSELLPPSSGRIIALTMQVVRTSKTSVNLYR
jgi:hypothetical protein